MQAVVDPVTPVLATAFPEPQQKFLLIPNEKHPSLGCACLLGQSPHLELTQTAEREGQTCEAETAAAFGMDVHRAAMQPANADMEDTLKALVGQVYDAPLVNADASVVHVEHA